MDAIALYVFELTLCSNLVLYRVRIFAVERQFYSVYYIDALYWYSVGVHLLQHTVELGDELLLHFSLYLLKIGRAHV